MDTHMLTRVFPPTSRAARSSSAAVGGAVGGDTHTLTGTLPAQALVKADLAGARIKVTARDYDGGFRALAPEPGAFGDSMADGAKMMDAGRSGSAAAAEARLAHHAGHSGRAAGRRRPAHADSNSSCDCTATVRTAGASGCASFATAGSGCDFTRAIVLRRALRR